MAGELLRALGVTVCRTPDLDDDVIWVEDRRILVIPDDMPTREVMATIGDLLVRCAA